MCVQPMCICACVCLQFVCLCVCVEETVCFCGSSNQPPAPSPNTCSPINMQRAGAHSLLSHQPLLSTPFLSPFLFFLSLPAPPSLLPRLAPYLYSCTPLSLFSVSSHMLLLCAYFFTPNCLVPLFLFFSLHVAISSTTTPAPPPSL